MTSAHAEKLTVREVMHPGMVSCAADTEAADVARMMASRSVHCVAVVSVAEAGLGSPRVWGIVSDLDVLSALTRPESAATAADLASEPVITVPPTLALPEAAEAMVRNGVHHLVVADPGRHTPLGVLSTLDVAWAMAGRPRQAPHRVGTAEPARRAAVARADEDRAAQIRSMLRDRASRNP